MDRREFIKHFGYAGVGVAIAPSLLSAVNAPQEEKLPFKIPDCPFRINDTIVVPVSDIHQVWGVFVITAIDPDGSISVIPLRAEQPIPEKAGDVFLHITWNDTGVQDRRYVHYEDKMTHQLYEVTTDPIFDGIAVKFKYKPSND